MTEVQHMRAQKHLVGPELYPFYVVVLKIALAAVICSAFLAGVVGAIRSGGMADAVASTLAIAWNGAFIAIGAVTLAFTLVERNAAARSKVLDAWEPLTRLGAIKLRSRTWLDRTAAIAAQSIFILWWTGAIQLSRFIPLTAAQSLRLDLANVWLTLFWPVLGLSIAVIAVNCMRLTGLMGRRLDHGLHLVLHLALLVVAAVALRSGVWINVSGSSMAGDAISAVDRGVNIGVQVGLIVTVCVAVVLAGVHAWCLVRPRTA